MAKKSEHLRVQMIKSKQIEVSPGSIITYVAGEFYNVEAEEAEKLIKEGYAIDLNAPIEGGNE